MNAAVDPNTQLLSLVKDLSIIAGGVIALMTLAIGLIQYARSLHQLRASQFVDMRRRFLEDQTFRRLLDRLATEDPLISNESIQDRRNLVGFLEEVGLMVNSGVIRYDVARAMFGYYVRLIANSEAFWDGLQRDSDSWTIFRYFAARLSRETRPVNIESLKL